MLVTEIKKDLSSYPHNFAVNGIILDCNDTFTIDYTPSVCYYNFNSYTIYDIADVDKILMLEEL